MKRKERWKSGWSQFSSDLDRALGQGIFLAAVLVIAAAIILPGGKDLFPDAEKIAKGLEAGYHTTLFRKGLSGEAVVFLLPLVSTLPYAASWLDERKNGYWKAYMPRTTKEKYAVSRITANAAGGGLCSALGYFLAYLILALIYRPMEAAAETPAISFGALALGGAAVFLMGVFWAGAGFLCSLLFRNRYMIYGGPFLLSYLMVIITSRYLPGVYTLNPREWLAMEHYWEGGSLGAAAFLAEISLLSMLAQYLMLKRRLEE